MPNRSQQHYLGALPLERVQFSTAVPSWAGIDAREHPVIAEINRIAAQLLEILGPMFWAALIVLSLWAELSAS